MVLLLTGQARWAQVASTLRDRRTLLWLLLAALLVGLNWLVFVYAVLQGQILQASLGYYITPLLSVLLGLGVLRETLRPLQWCCFALALVGVILTALAGTGFPWIALTLAFSFSFYGLVRKLIRIEPAIGLLLETTFLLPLAIGWLYFTWSDWTTGLAPLDHGLLALAGVITAVPLLCFNQALQRLRLSTLGFMQYVGPSVQFLLAVFLLQEPMNPRRWMSFAFIWVALALFTLDSWNHHRKPPGPWSKSANSSPHLRAAR
ncbi:MAG: EamA family transporter RarD [Phycisphaerales bacterium]|nr:EamA family transporter RarD [Phycisphaerales bacterium]